VVIDASPLEVRHWSGVSRYTADLVRALAGRRDPWNLAIASSRRLEASLPDLGLPRIGPGFPNRWLWMQTVLPAALARSRPALCHFTNYLAPLRCPVPYVLTIYDLSLLLFPRTQTARSRLLVRSLLPVVARRAAAVLTPSRVSRRHVLARLNVAPDRVHVVYGAPSMPASPADPAACRAACERHGVRPPFILAVGTLEPRKNLPRLVQAFALLRREGRQERLVLVGQRGWKSAPLFKQLRDQQVEDVVTVTGYVPDADLPALYGAASAMAFPSLYEGFGLPALEALSCGTPLVTSRLTAMQEMAGDAACYVDPADTESIAAGLRRVLEDSGLREDLRRRGVARARRFTWADVAARTSAVYAKTLDPAGAPVRD
jgi:glycosyltransferase involved in cell wall biosynthesis